MRRPICQRLYRGVVLFLAGTSGLMLAVLSGCDPTVSTAVLGGLNSLAKTLVDALFLALTPTTTTPVTTVQAITEAIRAMLA